MGRCPPKVHDWTINEDRVQVVKPVGVIVALPNKVMCGSLEECFHFQGKLGGRDQSLRVLTWVRGVMCQQVGSSARLPCSINRLLMSKRFIAV